MDRGRAHDLAEVLQRDRRQTITLSTKAGDLDGTISESRTALETAAAKQRELRQRLADEERTLTTLNHQADQLRAENEQQRTHYLEQMRAGAALANEISALEAQLARSEERREKCLRRLAEIAAQREQSQAAFCELQLERTKSVETSHSLQQQLIVARQKLDETRKALAATSVTLLNSKKHMLVNQSAQHSWPSGKPNSKVLKPEPRASFKLLPMSR